MTFLKDLGWCFTEMTIKETSQTIFILMILICFILIFEYRYFFNKSNNKTIDALIAHTTLAISEVAKK